MTPEALAEPLHLYRAGDALQHRMMTASGASRAGAGDFSGENRPYGAILTYSLNLPGLPLPDDEKERERKEKERAAAKPATEPAGPASRQEDPPEVTGDAPPQETEEAKEAEEAKGKGKEREAKVEILIADASGKVLKKLKGPAKLGVNRATWDLTRDAYKRPSGEETSPGREPAGPEVPPGTYGVTVKLRGKEAKGTVRVLPDPRARTAEAGWSERWAAIERAGALQERVVQAIERLDSARTDVGIVLAKLEKAKGAAGGAGGAGGEGGEGKDANEPLRKAARALQGRLDAMELKLWIPPKTQGLFRDRDLYSKVSNLGFMLGSSWDAPNDTQRSYVRNVEIETSDVLADFDRLFAGDVAAFRQQVQAAGIGLLPVQEPLAVPPGR
jgi:hypothetical protein